MSHNLIGGLWRLLKVGFLPALSLLVLTCDDDGGFILDPHAPADTGYVYSVPAESDDGWETDHLDSVGVDHRLIETMVNEISDVTMPQLHSILIVRDGRLVFEEYFNGWPQDSLHMLMSCTKSVTSCLVGLAIARGHLEGIDESIYSFFPEHDSLRTPLRDSMLIRHAITMTGGQDWDQSTYEYDDPRNSLIGMWMCYCDWLRYILSLEMINTPGTVWEYSDAMAIITGEVVSRAVGMSASDWAWQELFVPLGITNVDWRHTNGSYTNTGYGLYMRSRDMAKFGLLYLDGGRWNGQQLVPQSWVDESTAEAVSLGTTYGYGYFWWRVKYRLADYSLVQTIFALGNQGQQIYLVPSANTVVVFTMGRPSNHGYEEARWAMVNHILPALR